MTTAAHQEMMNEQLAKDFARIARSATTCADTSSTKGWSDNPAILEEVIKTFKGMVRTLERNTAELIAGPHNEAV